MMLPTANVLGFSTGNMVQTTFPLPKDLDERAEHLFLEHQQRIHRNTDRLFAALILLQWSGGVLAANWILPQTWIEGSVYVGRHAWGSGLLGGGVAAAAILFALLRPRRARRPRWRSRQNCSTELLELSKDDPSHIGVGVVGRVKDARL